jgi:hypothetical protein
MIDEVQYEVFARVANGPVSIYILTDPRDNSVRYVGQSADPASRLLGHISDNHMITKSRKHSWVLNLRAIGMTPRMFVVDNVETAESNAAERRWIEHFRAKGADLLNKPTYAKFNRSPRLARRVPVDTPNADVTNTSLRAAAEVSRVLGVLLCELVFVEEKQ